MEMTTERLITILDTNGLDEAIQGLSSLHQSHDKQIRLFAVACARQVQHLMTDQRSIDALDVVERYEAGLATRDDLAIAADAADAAFKSAAAAGAAIPALFAAYAAAEYSSLTAAQSAADAVFGANGAAALAAYIAAYSLAVRVSNTDVARAMADAARGDAYDAARAKQADIFRKFFS